jgi:hypothetical protein
MRRIIVIAALCIAFAGCATTPPQKHGVDVTPDEDGETYRGVEYVR